jgi:hypothetical protein
MTLAGIREGDLVRVIKRRGVEFYAEVLSNEDGQLRLRPLDHRVSDRTATAREVKDHWRKSRRRATDRRGSCDAETVEVGS